MSHGVGPLFLTGPSNTEILSPLSTTVKEPVNETSTETGTNRLRGVGVSNSDDGNISVGETRISIPTGQIARNLGRIYWNHLDEDWAENTQTTVAVFTTPSASVGGRSLNPISEVDEDQFVTDEGAQYLEESGIRESAGLGPNLSWVVTPAWVASRSISFLGNQTTLRSYVGYVKTGDSEIPRTLLINLAITETGDDIAFGVTVQHRDMYSLGNSDSTAPSDGILSAMSVPNLVGPAAFNGLNMVDDMTLIVEAGVAASADLASTALGDLSLA